MSAPENPPAFPVAEVRAVDDGSIGISEGHSGMTLRDWFAGQALAGQLANSRAKCDGVGEPPCALEFAADSYALADAMLAERAKVCW